MNILIFNLTFETIQMTNWNNFFNIECKINILFNLELNNRQIF